MDTSKSGKSCAIVVTHKPDITALLKLLGQLNKEVDFVVVDNGTADIDHLAESICVYDRCEKLVRLNENVGLAKALNKGIEWAIENQCEFVFLFDQDSSICDLFISRMIEAYREVEPFSEQGIAAVGPRLINPQSMSQTPFKLFNRLIYRSDRPFADSKKHFIADFLITSGTLLTVKHIADIGGMKENYFIDNIDLEWCFRAKARGYDLIGTDEAVLYHAIGERSQSPLVKAGILAMHNPSRTYYSSRNRTHLYGVKYSPIGWKVRDRIRFALKALWLLLSSPDRKLYWQNIRSGIRDAKTIS